MRYSSIALCFILGWSSLVYVVAMQAPRDSLCVVHLEAPKYPRLAHLAQLEETIEVTAEINENGQVIAARASKDSPFQDEVENNVRKWTFKHLPANSKFPISHTIHFEFKLEGDRDYSPPKVTFDLPDRVRVVAHPLPME